MLRRKIFLASLVLGLFGSAVATGAVVLTGNSQINRIDPENSVVPHLSSTSYYAYVDNESGEIVIDLTDGKDAVNGYGVNLETLKSVDDVFTLVYTGEEFTHVSFELT